MDQMVRWYLERLPGGDAVEMNVFRADPRPHYVKVAVGPYAEARDVERSYCYLESPILAQKVFDLPVVASSFGALDDRITGQLATRLAQLANHEFPGNDAGGGPEDDQEA